ncbi:hypothetical protein ACTL6P_01385 [Endozoicomonas acroporae]|nr:hypothetical protein [Endozoicomonas acroporae]
MVKDLFIAFHPINHQILKGFLECLPEVSTLLTAAACCKGSLATASS